jgi:hypothetical protein
MQTCRARLSWKGWLSMPLPPAIAFAIGGGAAHRQGLPCLVAADAPVDTVTVDMAMFVANMPALGKAAALVDRLRCQRCRAAAR